MYLVAKILDKPDCSLRLQLYHYTRFVYKYSVITYDSFIKQSSGSYTKVIQFLKS